MRTVPHTKKHNCSNQKRIFFKFAPEFTVNASRCTSDGLGVLLAKKRRRFLKTRKKNEEGAKNIEEEVNERRTAVNSGVQLPRTTPTTGASRPA